MAHKFELTATRRQDVGKGASRRLRREADAVPAVVYGTGKETVSLTLEHRHVIKALSNEAFFSHILDLIVDGKLEKVVLKDVQRHPYKPRILHLDFLRISAKEKITMHVPLHFEGEEVAPGVKLDGGMVSHHLSQVEVYCLPKDLPEFISVDISNLELDKSLHLSDLKAPQGVEFSALTQETPNDLAVVAIHKPRAQVEEEPVVSAEVAEEATEEPTSDADDTEK